MRLNLKHGKYSNWYDTEYFRYYIIIDLCKAKDSYKYFPKFHKRDKSKQNDKRPQDQIYHIMYTNVMPYQSYYEHSAQFQFLTDEQIVSI